MTPDQLKRREALLYRNDAALDRWPQRSGKDFVREMTAVAKGLEALAREVDTAQGDQLERSRNWRFVGNADFDLANAKDLELLKLAADAYKKAEALLAGVDNAIEKMKLDYGYGHALFHLSDAKDLAFVQEARRRYASALEIACAKMPAGVESAKSALANADRVIELLTQAEGLSRRISDLEKEKAEVPPKFRLQDMSGDLERLRAILGHLADVERRLQSQVSVPLEEMKQVAQEVDELQALAQQMGSQSGPWDIFYRKYNALLHDHLQDAGLRRDFLTPLVWDYSEALRQVTGYFNESESNLRTVTFVRDLYQVVEQLESGQQVSDQVLQPLLDQMKEKADTILELAPEHPQLPAQFARVRERLWALLEKQGRKEGR
jgi:hypothetical protein